MANKKQLKILNQGVEAWNAWRKENNDVNVNLSGANLKGVNLSEADLGWADLDRADLDGADLSWANLSWANLKGAELHKADLNGADLTTANLIEANLKGADLTSTSLRETNLTGTNLSFAILRRANLTGANLSGADFNETHTRLTSFVNIKLNDVINLDKLFHDGPSPIGLDTIRLSEGKLPIEFLRGCGLSDYDIKAVKLYDPDLSSGAYNDLLYELSDLRNSGAIQFHSCFISYSSQDETLANRLYTELQDSGVRCWYAPEDLKIGEKISTGVDRAISMHQKLLLIISKDSIASNWVEREVERAIRREGTENIDMIFPIRLDDEIMHIEEGWAAYVRNLRHIGDFRDWHNEANYKKAFGRLKQDLQQNVERDHGE